MRDELRSQVELIHNSMPKPVPTATTEPLLTSSTHLLAAEGMAFEGTVELRGRLRPVSDSSHTTTKTTPAEVSTDTTVQLIPNSTLPVPPIPVPTSPAVTQPIAPAATDTTDPVSTTPTVQLIPNSTQAVLPKPVPIATAEPLLTSSTQSPESTQEKTVIECRQAIRYGCQVCNEFVCYTRAESDKHLLTHMESMDGSMTFMCTLCEHCISQSEQEVSDHLREDHLFYKCVIGCDFRFESFQSIESHSKYWHEIDYYCKLCNYSSALFVSLVKHNHYVHFMDWTESHSYECCFCRDIIHESNEILDHLRRHWQQFSGFDCKFCPTKEMMSFTSLRQHLKVEHNTEEHLKTYSTKMFKDLKSKMIQINIKWEDDKDRRRKRCCRKCKKWIVNNQFKGHTCQGKKSNTTVPMLPMSATPPSPSPTPEGHIDKPLASCSSQKSVSK